MNNILRKYLNQFYIAYLNNILIYSEIKEQYIKYVRKILRAFQTKNLLIKIEKYKFYK